MFVPETLMTPLRDLADEYERARRDPQFQAELADLLADFAGRPTPLYFAERLTKKLGGAKIYFKREDLLHTGAHKINNALGQILLARRMGKQRIIAETGAGQHGVATATAAAHFGLECVVYMGKVDMERQSLNVARMRFPRGKSGPRHRRGRHVERSDQRSNARLGHQRPHDFLHPRQRARLAPLPDDGAGFSPGDRRGGAAADPGAGGASCRTS